MARPIVQSYLDKKYTGDIQTFLMAFSIRLPDIVLNKKERSQIAAQFN